MKESLPKIPTKHVVKRPIPLVDSAKIRNSLTQETLRAHDHHVIVCL